MKGATATVRARRKTKVGRVVSDKMDKTIVVSVERLTRHRLYKRVIRLTTRFKAHDERNEAHVGDTVRIEESRPLSATKRWRLVSIVRRAGEGAGEPVVAEEEATAEAIHGGRHPVRPVLDAEAAADGPTSAEATSAEATRAQATRAGAASVAEASVEDATRPEPTVAADEPVGTELEA